MTPLTTFRLSGTRRTDWRPAAAAAAAATDAVQHHVGVVVPAECVDRRSKLVQLHVLERALQTVNGFEKHLYRAGTRLLCGGYSCDSTSIRRPFD